MPDMTPVVRVDLTSSDARDQIKPLHVALRFFWSVSPPLVTPPTAPDIEAFGREEGQQAAADAYGNITRRLVKDYRIRQGIGNTDETDDLTAADMNIRLLERQQLSGAGITGIVSTDTSGNQGVRNLKVQACNFQGEGTEPPLGTPIHSGANGRYSIFLKELDNKPQNVFVKAIGRKKSENDAELARTPIAWDGFGQNNRTIDMKVLTVAAADIVPIEYDLIFKVIDTKKGTLNLPADILDFSDANVKTLKRLPELAEVPIEAVEHCILSHLLARDIPRPNVGEQPGPDPLDPKFFYAFLRTDALLFTLWTIPPKAQTSLRLADMQKSEELGHSRRQEQIAKIAFYSTLKVNSCSEDDVKSVVDTAADRRYIDWPYPGQDYSLKLAAQRERLGPDYTGPIGDLQKAIDARYPPPADGKPPPLRGFHVLASGDLFLYHGVGAADDPLLKKLADDGELMPEYRNVCTAVLAITAPKFAHFDLRAGNAYALAADQGWDRKQTSRLLSLQRVVKLTTELPEIRFLLKGGLDAAWRVRNLGRSAFIAQYVDAMGGIDNPDIEKKAGELFDKAVRAAETTSQLAGEARALMTAQHVEALSPGADRAKLRAMLKPDDGSSGAGAKIPSWEQLFGSLDACGCDECQSILGPGSYLVDVLQYFKRLRAKPHEGKERSAFDVLVKRRPDVGYIDLSCANAMTEVPYIDMVCELLEDEIVRSYWSVALQLEPDKKISKDDLSQLRNTRGSVRTASETG
jgi:hypothetical protein